MRYIIYSRVSTENQDVSMQNQTCLSRIQEMGGEDITLISDNDLSTSVHMSMRPGLQKMLGMLNRNTTVVVYTIDRLARDEIELPTIRRQIKDKGAQLLSCNEGKEEIVLDMMGVIAKHEKKRIIQRTVDNLKEKQRRLERVGTTWYGYKLDQTKLQLSNERGRSYGKPYLLIPDEDEQRNIALMLELRKKGFGIHRICKKLTELGYMNRSGNPFQVVSVDRILRRLENRISHSRKSYRKKTQSSKSSLDQDGITSNMGQEKPFDLLESLSHLDNLSKV